MAYQVRYEGAIATFTNETGAEIGAHLRVKLVASSTLNPPGVELAGSADNAIGITNRWAADGATVAVILGSAEGTRLGIADGAIARGAEVFADASGGVSGAGTVSLGHCIDGSSAAGDIISYARSNA